MKCRRNVKRLTSLEKAKFAQAVVKLKDKSQFPGLIDSNWSRYDDFVATHLHAMHNGAQWAHGDSAFFPWHRALLFQFERLIQGIPGFENVTVPYWDWTREKNATSNGFPFTHDFLGVDGDDTASDEVKREAGAPMPYPYPFDPETWAIRVKDSTGDSSHLRRAFGERSDAPNLPDNDLVMTGTGATFRGAIGVAGYEALRSQSEDLHNLVHRWTGGNMLDMTSPNDPVFFLHHSEIDRMWSLWQHKHPSATFYVNTSGLAGHGLNDDMIFHHSADPAPWSGTAKPADMIDGHALHGIGVWYDSDLPDITLETASVDFSDVPQDMTQFRAVRFNVRTGRRVRFRITSAPSGNFGLTPMGTEFVLEPDFDAADQHALVWVQFHAVGAANQASSVTIEAYIIDEEGYYAATEGGEFTKPAWHYTVTLSAHVIPRVDNAVALVLDRSYSMTANAGGTSTRSGLLKDAVKVFFDLLLPDDELGIVSFDDQMDTLIGMTRKSLIADINTIVDGGGLDPRGDTSIGGGIKAGRVVLNGATAGYHQAMLVLTDGNENTPPMIAQADSDGDITAQTYAIGFGLPGGVSAPKLNEITHNTGGDLIITGNLSSDEQRFLLSKYFIQVLAGISREQIVLDPKGDLLWNSVHTIPFDVADADIRIDAIALCPLPHLLDFRLITPGGQEITPSTAAATNVHFVIGHGVCFYRVMLPAVPGDAAGSHRGQWHAVFRLADRGDIQKRLRETRLDVEAFASTANRGVMPYNLMIRSLSNLELDARAVQTSFEPGAEVRLYASLREYAVPLSGTALVRAEVSSPDGSIRELLYRQVGQGVFEAAFKTTVAGAYTCRVRASGYSVRGAAFTREKVVTAGVFQGGDRPSDAAPIIDWFTHRDEQVCQLIACLFSDGVMSERFRRLVHELGIDLDAVKKCLTHAYCRPKAGRPRAAAKDLLLVPEIRNVIELLARRSVELDARLGVLEPEPGQPVKRQQLPPTRKVSAGSRPFMREGHTDTEKKASGPDKGKR